MKERGLDGPYTLISTVIVGLAAILTIRQPALYRPYFGDLPPSIAIAGVFLCGWLALASLNKTGTFLTARPGARLRHAVIAAALAVPFMVIVTIADWSNGLPRDMNVPLPHGLLFYPVMGYAVQLVMRAVPLAIIERVLDGLASSWSRRTRVFLSIAIVAGIESAYQVLYAGTDCIAALFVAMHLLAFGLVELYVFLKFDFVSMFVFRMTYYAYWHLLWGHLRLTILY